MKNLGSSVSFGYHDNIYKLFTVILMCRIIVFLSLSFLMLSVCFVTWSLTVNL